MERIFDRRFAIGRRDFNAATMNGPSVIESAARRVEKGRREDSAKGARRDLLMSPPLVQESNLLLDGHTGRLEIPDRVGDTSVGHVAGGIIVPALDQQAGMRSSRRDNEVMKLLKVLIIARHEGQVVVDRISKLRRVGSMQQAHVLRRDDRMSRGAEPLHETLAGRILIEVESHE